MNLSEGVSPVYDKPAEPWQPPWIVDAMKLPVDPQPQPIDLPLRPGTFSKLHPKMRLDPYYSGWWTGRDQNYLWASASQTRAMKKHAKGSVFAHITSEERALSWVLSRNQLPVSLAVIAIVYSYRLVTVDQVAAIAGIYRNRAFDEHVVALHAAGFLDLGRYSAGLFTLSEDDFGSFGVRLSQRFDWKQVLLARLSLPERVAVTGGRELRRGIATARHNVLATEALLRMASFLPEIAAIGGEALSLGKLVLPQFFGPTANKSGDGLAVRDDGLRIILELTASASPGLGDKVATWVEALRASPNSGTVIVFVEAIPEEYSRKRTFGSMKRRIGNVIEERFGGGWFEEATSRILIASWGAWFHREGPTDFFRTLRVAQYVSSEKKWRDVNLVGPGRLEDPGVDRALIRGLQSTFVTPPWTRVDPYPLHMLAPLELGLDQPPLDMSNRPDVAVSDNLAPVMRLTTAKLNAQIPHET